MNRDTPSRPVSANLQKVIIAFGKGALFAVVKSVVIVVKGSCEVGEKT